MASHATRCPKGGALVQFGVHTACAICRLLFEGGNAQDVGVLPTAVGTACRTACQNSAWLVSRCVPIIPDVACLVLDLTYHKRSKADALATFAVGACGTAACCAVGGAASVGVALLAPSYAVVSGVASTWGSFFVAVARPAVIGAIAGAAVVHLGNKMLKKRRREKRLRELEKDLLFPSIPADQAEVQKMARRGMMHCHPDRPDGSHDKAIAYGHHLDEYVRLRFSGDASGFTLSDFGSKILSWYGSISNRFSFSAAFRSRNSGLYVRGLRTVHARKKISSANGRCLLSGMPVTRLCRDGASPCPSRRPSTRHCGTLRFASVGRS